MLFRSNQRAQQEIAAVKMQAAQDATAMKMANEFMRMRVDNNGNNNNQQPYNGAYGAYPQQPYNGAYGAYPQQPYNQPYGGYPQQSQQLPPPQPSQVIIHTAEPQKKMRVIDADARPAQGQPTYPPDSVTTSTTTTTTRVDTTKGHDGHDGIDDIDGFYDDYYGNK